MGGMGGGLPAACIKAADKPESARFLVCLQRKNHWKSIARVVKLVNTADLKSAAARPDGSSPFPGTTVTND